MKIGISSFFFSKENFLSLLKESLRYGFRFIELAYELPYSEILETHFLSELKEFKKEGVEFSLHGPWIETNLGSYFEDIRAFSIKRIKESIEIAETLQIEILVIHPGYYFFKGSKEINERVKNIFFEELSKIKEFSKGKGVRICLENMPFPFSFFSEFEDLKDFPRGFDIPICYDIGHALISKFNKYEDPEKKIIAELRTHRDNILHIHLHNNNGIMDDHNLFEGKINLLNILHAFVDLNFQGTIILESHDIERFGVERFYRWINSIPWFKGFPPFESQR